MISSTCTKHIVSVQQVPGGPVATLVLPEGEADRQARESAATAHRVLVDGSVVPAADGTVNVLITVPVKVDLATWMLTYGQTVGEATTDIPQHVKDTIVGHAEVAFAAIDAGATVLTDQVTVD